MYKDIEGKEDMIKSLTGKYSLGTRSYFGKEDDYDGEDIAYLYLYDNKGKRIAETETGFDQYTKFTTPLMTGKPIFSNDEKFIFLKIHNFSKPDANYIKVFAIDLDAKFPFLILKQIANVRFTANCKQSLEEFTYDKLSNSLIIAKNELVEKINEEKSFSVL